MSELSHRWSQEPQISQPPAVVLWLHKKPMDCELRQSIHLFPHSFADLSVELESPPEGHHPFTIVLHFLSLLQTCSFSKWRNCGDLSCFLLVSNVYQWVIAKKTQSEKKNTQKTVPWHHNAVPNGKHYT